MRRGRGRGRGMRRGRGRARARGIPGDRGGAGSRGGAPAATAMPVHGAPSAGPATGVAAALGVAAARAGGAVRPPGVGAAVTGRCTGGPAGTDVRSGGEGPLFMIPEANRRRPGPTRAEDPFRGGRSALFRGPKRGPGGRGRWTVRPRTRRGRRDDAGHRPAGSHRTAGYGCPGHVSSCPSGRGRAAPARSPSGRPTRRAGRMSATPRRRRPAQRRRRERRPRRGVADESAHRTGRKLRP